MSRRQKYLASAAAAVALLAGGITLATVAPLGEEPLPYHPGQRGFDNVTTVVGGTTYVCTSPCVTETLATNGQVTDRVRALALVDGAVVDLLKTTISGKRYCREMAGLTCGGTGYAYRGGAWYRGLGALTLARSLSAGSDLYNVAGPHLIATTVSGVAYSADPARYAGGHWDIALRTLASERAFLWANPLKTGPSIYTR